MSFFKKNKKRLSGFGVFVVALSGFFVVFMRIVAGPKEAQLPVRSTEQPATKTVGATFKVMTLNLAHGRLDGAHQALLSDKKIEENLSTVAEVIRREDPFILGVQEADDESWWSSRKNHVKLLAEKTAPVNFVQGHHIQGLGLKYGTAILSQGAMAKAYSYRFGYSPPTLLKGFVLSQVTLSPGRELCFVSLHLDFLREKVRARQLERLKEVLSKVPGAKVVVGDFNCEWKDGSALARFAEDLGLKAYKAESKELTTFPTFKTRIDWILISEDLSFESYSVLDDPISDHRAVVATLKDRRKP